MRTKITGPRTFTVVGPSRKVEKRIETELVPWLLNNPNDAEEVTVIGPDGEEYRLVNHPTLEPVGVVEQKPVTVGKKRGRKSKAEKEAEAKANEAKHNAGGAIPTPGSLLDEKGGGKNGAKDVTA